ncbi:MAG: diguanylate cyclase [Myxococcales bacterium]|nr:diguanylate cyclase [Myxococcales bacterium]
MPAYALIAEPDPAQAQLYGHIAAAEGLEVKLVRGAAEALAFVQLAGAPALTITELSLAGTDGFQLIEEIRKLASEEHAPVVAISAFRALRDTALRLRGELGISALLARSAPADSIRRAVKKVLAASHAPHGPAPSTAPPPPVATLHGIDEERAEEIRLHRIDQMGLAAAEPDAELDRIAEETAKRFGVPAAMISLVLEEKQWAIGAHGVPDEARVVQREHSFCTHVVQGRQPLVVADAVHHPGFEENPLVQKGLVGSYAGAPLETPSGDVLGTLCILDRKPLAVTPEDVDELVLLARGVAGELELRVGKKRQQHDLSLLPEPLRRELTAVSYLTAVLDNIDNGVFLLDAQRKVIFANQALADLFGVTPDSLIGRHGDEVVHEAAQSSSDPDDFLRKLKVSPAGAYAIRGEFEMERPRRRFLRWMAKPVQLGDGVGQLTVLTDVTAEMDLIRERDHLARTDPITGLMNRRAAEEVLEREASRAQRFGSRISVALIDLDHFKQVNDRFGHAAGDDALRATAQVLNSAMRGVDVAARWGGDELLAILPATGLEGARSFGERVRAAVEGLGAQVMRGATLSVGVAELQPGEDWADAVRRADAKLYEAKDAGRNRVA